MMAPTIEITQGNEEVFIVKPIYQKLSNKRKALALKVLHNWIIEEMIKIRDYAKK